MEHAENEEAGARQAEGRPFPRRILRLVRLGGLAAGVSFLLAVLAVLPWRWIDPPTTTFIELYGGDSPAHEWVDWADISPSIPIALVASEDQRFPDHWGLDLGAIRQVLDEAGATRGASTITQQVAKNLYLWAGRSWVRKGLEAGLTLLIEALWPKRRILEVYVNVAQFGPAVFGAQAASRTYFGKPASEVTSFEAALMAVVLPSPRRMSLARPSGYMQGRARWVQQQVAQLGGPAYLAGL